MSKLSFYEQAGIVIPGAMFLFGIMFFIPELKNLISKDGFDVGGLGVFVLISYASGHLLAALGNLIESIYWNFKGGMPSNWIVGPKPKILANSQIDKIQALTATRLGLSIKPLAELTAKEWFPVFRQIYSDVELYGKADRGNTFNGNYGLNRGLCAAALALAVVTLFLKPFQWTLAAGLLVVGLVYLYRMHRFGVHYAREIYNQFLLLPAEREKPKKAATNEASDD